jgi:hypothetical protein
LQFIEKTAPPAQKELALDLLFGCPLSSDQDGQDKFMTINAERLQCATLPSSRRIHSQMLAAQRE